MRDILHRQVSRAGACQTAMQALWAMSIVHRRRYPADPAARSRSSLSLSVWDCEGEPKTALAVLAAMRRHLNDADVCRQAAVVIRSLELDHRVASDARLIVSEAGAAELLAQAALLHFESPSVAVTCMLALTGLPLSYLPAALALRLAEAAVRVLQRRPDSDSGPSVDAAATLLSKLLESDKLGAPADGRGRGHIAAAGDGAAADARVSDGARRGSYRKAGNACAAAPASASLADRIAQLVRDGGGIEALVSATGLHQADLSVSHAIAAALLALCLHSDALGRCAAAEVDVALLSILRTHGSAFDAVFVSNMCGCIAAFAGQLAFASSLARAGAVPVLVAVLQQHAVSSEDREDTAAALASGILPTDGTGLLAQAAALSKAEVKERRTEAAAASAAVAQAAFSALADLCALHGGRSDCRGPAALRTIVAALRNNSRSAAAANAGCNLLVAIATADDESERAAPPRGAGREAASEAAAVLAGADIDAALLAIFTQHPTDAEVLVRAGRAVCRLTFYQPTARQLLAGGIVHALFAWQGRFSENLWPATRVSCALSNLLPLAGPQGLGVPFETLVPWLGHNIVRLGHLLCSATDTTTEGGLYVELPAGPATVSAAAADFCALLDSVVGQPALVGNEELMRSLGHPDVLRALLLALQQDDGGCGCDVISGLNEVGGGDVRTEPSGSGRVDSTAAVICRCLHRAAQLGCISLESAEHFLRSGGDDALVAVMYAQAGTRGVKHVCDAVAAAAAMSGDCTMLLSKAGVGGALSFALRRCIDGAGDFEAKLPVIAAALAAVEGASKHKDVLPSLPVRRLVGMLIPLLQEQARRLRLPAEYSFLLTATTEQLAVVYAGCASSVESVSADRIDVLGRLVLAACSLLCRQELTPRRAAAAQECALEVGSALILPVVRILSAVFLKLVSGAACCLPAATVATDSVAGAHGDADTGESKGAGAGAGSTTAHAAATYTCAAGSSTRSAGTTTAESDGGSAVDANESGLEAPTFRLLSTPAARYLVWNACMLVSRCAEDEALFDAVEAVPVWVAPVVGALAEVLQHAVDKRAAGAFGSMWQAIAYAACSAVRKLAEHPMCRPAMVASTGALCASTAAHMAFPTTAGALTEASESATSATEADSLPACLFALRQVTAAFCGLERGLSDSEFELHLLGEACSAVRNISASPAHRTALMAVRLDIPLVQTVLRICGEGGNEPHAAAQVVFAALGALFGLSCEPSNLAGLDPELLPIAAAAMAAMGPQAYFWSPAIAWVGCGVLLRLVQANPLLEPRTLGVCGAALVTHPSDDRVVRAACAALLRVASHPGGRAALITADAAGLASKLRRRLEMFLAGDGSEEALSESAEVAFRSLLAALQP